MNVNRVLVTGASGFVGRFLLEKLLENESNQITALYNNTLAEDLYEYGNTRITWIKLDLTCENLTNALSDINIIYHLAGYSSVSGSSDECKMLEDININVTKHLAKQCKLTTVKQFIFVSSIAACELSPSLIIDEENGHPITSYGKSKKKAENILFDIAKGHYHVTIFRPTALFGEEHKGSIYELVQKIDKKQFVIFGAGNNLTNFYYIRDFVDLLVLAQGNKKTYNQIFIASDTAYKLKVLVDWITDALDTKLYIRQLPYGIGLLAAIFFTFISKVSQKNLDFSLRRLRAMTKTVVYSNDKVRETIGLKIKYGTHAGLLRTIKWYEENGLL